MQASSALYPSHLDPYGVPIATAPADAASSPPSERPPEALVPARPTPPAPTSGDVFGAKELRWNSFPDPVSLPTNWHKRLWRRPQRSSLGSSDAFERDDREEDFCSSLSSSLSATPRRGPAQPLFTPPPPATESDTPQKPTQPLSNGMRKEPEKPTVEKESAAVTTMHVSRGKEEALNTDVLDTSKKSSSRAPDETPIPTEMNARMHFSTLQALPLNIIPKDRNIPLELTAEAKRLKVSSPTPRERTLSADREMASPPPPPTGLFSPFHPSSTLTKGVFSLQHCTEKRSITTTSSEAAQPLPNSAPSKNYSVSIPEATLRDHHQAAPEADAWEVKKLCHISNFLSCSSYIRHVRRIQGQQAKLLEAMRGEINAECRGCTSSSPRYVEEKGRGSGSHDGVIRMSGGTAAPRDSGSTAFSPLTSSSPSSASTAQLEALRREGQEQFQRLERGFSQPTDQNGEEAAAQEGLRHSPSTSSFVEVLQSTLECARRSRERSSRSRTATSTTSSAEQDGERPQEEEEVPQRCEPSPSPAPAAPLPNGRELRLWKSLSPNTGTEAERQVVELRRQLFHCMQRQSKLLPALCGAGTNSSEVQELLHELEPSTALPFAPVTSRLGGQSKQRNSSSPNTNTEASRSPRGSSIELTATLAHAPRCVLFREAVRLTKETQELLASLSGQLSFLHGTTVPLVSVSPPTSQSDAHSPSVSTLSEMTPSPSPSRPHTRTGLRTPITAPPPVSATTAIPSALPGTVRRSMTTLSPPSPYRGEISSCPISPAAAHRAALGVGVRSAIAECSPPSCGISPVPLRNKDLSSSGFQLLETIVVSPLSAQQERHLGAYGREREHPEAMSSGSRERSSTSGSPAAFSSSSAAAKRVEASRALFDGQTEAEDVEEEETAAPTPLLQQRPDGTFTTVPAEERRERPGAVERHAQTFSRSEGSLELEKRSEKAVSSLDQRRSYATASSLSNPLSSTATNTSSSPSLQPLHTRGTSEGRQRDWEERVNDYVNVLQAAVEKEMQLLRTDSAMFAPSSEDAAPRTAEEPSSPPPLRSSFPGVPPPHPRSSSILYPLNAGVEEVKEDVTPPEASNVFCRSDAGRGRRSELNAAPPEVPFSDPFSSDEPPIQEQKEVNAEGISSFPTVEHTRVQEKVDEWVASLHLRPTERKSPAKATTDRETFGSSRARQPLNDVRVPFSQEDVKNDNEALSETRLPSTATHLTFIQHVVQAVLEQLVVSYPRSAWKLRRRRYPSMRTKQREAAALPHSHTQHRSRQRSSRWESTHSHSSQWKGGDADASDRSDSSSPPTSSEKIKKYNSRRPTKTSRFATSLLHRPVSTSSSVGSSESGRVASRLLQRHTPMLAKEVQRLQRNSQKSLRKKPEDTKPKAVKYSLSVSTSSSDSASLRTSTEHPSSLKEGSEYSTDDDEGGSNARTRRESKHKTNISKEVRYSHPRMRDHHHTRKREAQITSGRAAAPHNTSQSTSSLYIQDDVWSAVVLSGQTQDHPYLCATADRFISKMKPSRAASRREERRKEPEEYYHECFVESPFAALRPPEPAVTPMNGALSSRQGQRTGSSAKEGEHTTTPSKAEYVRAQIWKRLGDTSALLPQFRTPSCSLPLEDSTPLHVQQVPVWQPPQLTPPSPGAAASSAPSGSMENMVRRSREILAWSRSKLQPQGPAGPLKPVENTISPRSAAALGPTTPTALLQSYQGHPFALVSSSSNSACVANAAPRPAEESAVRREGVSSRERSTSPAASAPRQSEPDGRPAADGRRSETRTNQYEERTSLGDFYRTEAAAPPLLTDHSYRSQVEEVETEEHTPASTPQTREGRLASQPSEWLTPPEIQNYWGVPPPPPPPPLATPAERAALLAELYHPPAPAFQPSREAVAERRVSFERHSPSLHRSFPTPSTPSPSPLRGGGSTSRWDHPHDNALLCAAPPQSRQASPTLVREGSAPRQALPPPPAAVNRFASPSVQVSLSPERDPTRSPSPTYSASTIATAPPGSRRGIAADGAGRRPGVPASSSVSVSPSGSSPLSTRSYHPTPTKVTGRGAALQGGVRAEEPPPFRTDRRGTSTSPPNNSSATRVHRSSSSPRQSVERDHHRPLSPHRRQTLLHGLERERERLLGQRDQLLEKHDLLYQKRLMLAQKMREKLSLGNQANRLKRPSATDMEQVAQIARKSKAALELVEGRIEIIDASLKKTDQQIDLLLHDDV